VEEIVYDNATDLFDSKLFPEAILLNMPSDEFWNGEPKWLLSYIESCRLKQEREEKTQSSLIDYQSWLTGLYVHQSVMVALQNAFSKNGKAKYIKEPISFTATKKESKDAQIEADKAMENQYILFKRLTDNMNKGIHKR